MHGPTPICILEGIMNKELCRWKLFVKRLCRTFTPLSLRPVLIGLCRTMILNMCPDISLHADLKICSTRITVSRYAQDFLANSDINWWKSPAESPDLNLIKHLWHELKRIHSQKSKMSNELVNGILAFWATVDVAKCRQYTPHLKIMHVWTTSNNLLLDPPLL